MSLNFTRLSRITGLFMMTLILGSSCKKDTTAPADTDPLTTTWVLQKFDNGIYEYKAATQLDNDKPGYIFKANGNLIERENSGWCGTPPIAYSNFDGKWNKTGDNKIAVKGTYWGGDRNYTIEVVAVTASTLQIKMLP